jgi:hypothetical protein
MRTARTTWRKSSYSSSDPTDNCVEVALSSESAAVRDSKNPNGPTLAIPANHWRTFLDRGCEATF